MNAQWIGSGKRNDKHNALPPELFRKTFTLGEKPKQAELTVSALGIYEARINGQRVGEDWFTPGYTHYESYVQAQSYDVTNLLQPGGNTLDILVANGWWLGTLGKKNNHFGKHHGVIAELLLDGQRIATDTSWCVTQDMPERFADFYDGETIDLTRANEADWNFSPVTVLTGKLPEVKPHHGAYVREQQRLTPVSQSGGIYDFGQNHAGVLHLVAEAARGTVITIRHAEILDRDGGLFTKNLRRAKATLTLVCGEDGRNEFSPRFTFMGFRYAEVTAAAPVHVQTIESIVLSGDCPVTGNFSCSNELLNRLYQNIQWGQCSNFIDIPTDCPQRDERMGWTGDIAVFAETASMNRNIHDFMRKWLYDLRLYQRKNGTLPVTVPEDRSYAPSPFPIPIAIWGDAATMVPWAAYRAYGDIELLSRQYESMKAYADAELRIARRGRHPYLWDSNLFQYGDWCAPGEGYPSWLRKGRFISTAFMLNSVNIVRQAAEALRQADDATFYAGEAEKIRTAFKKYCLMPNGRLTGDFQTNYVTALYFGLAPEDARPALAKRLAELVRENGYKIATGFAGTPYILFALADNGYAEDAYRLLLNEDCPGWLYTVKAGATTMWERWDALDDSGSIRADSIPNMVSFNHYAYGAVGAFFYRRILGIEPLEPGYRRFAIRPVISKELAHAEGTLETCAGRIEVRWEIEGKQVTLYTTVPEGSICEITLPNGERHTATGGYHDYEIGG